MIFVLLSKLMAVRLQRPAGYVEAFLEAGSIAGYKLWLDERTCARLHERFGAGKLLGGARQSAPATAEETARREAICAGCEWNIGLVCEHPGCQPCRLRKAGGLKAVIAASSSRCPAGKW